MTAEEAALKGGNPGKKAPGYYKPAPEVVEVEHEMPVMPSFLNDRGTQIWNGLIPDLLSMGVVHRIDSFNIGMLCMFMAEAWRCADVVSKETGQMINPNDTTSQRPEMKIAQASYAAASRIMDDYGINHKARQALGLKLKVPKGTDDGSSKKANNKHGLD